jgi:predicted membrane protein
MNLGSFKKFSVPEILLLIFFIIYILFPIGTPQSLKYAIHSPIGMIFIFAISVSLFVYTNPTLGIMSIFVAYELLRRSAIGKNNYNTPDVKSFGKQSNQVEQNPIQFDQLYQQQHVTDSFSDINILDSHSPLSIPVERSEESPHSFAFQTLEEEVIQQRAPVGHSDPLKLVDSSFLPVASDVKQASMF